MIRYGRDCGGDGEDYFYGETKEDIQDIVIKWMAFDSLEQFEESSGHSWDLLVNEWFTIIGDTYSDKHRVFTTKEHNITLDVLPIQYAWK